MLNEIIKKTTKKYSNLSNETIDKWKENIKILELKKGTQLVKEREFTNKLYFIYKGSAKVGLLHKIKNLDKYKQVVFL